MRFTTYITLFNPSSTADSYGQPGAPVAIATVRAEKVELSGRELYSARQFAAETTSKFIIRYVAGVSAKMTFREEFTGRMYKVLYPQVDDKFRSIQLFAKEIHNEGWETPSLG